MRIQRKKEKKRICDHPASRSRTSDLRISGVFDHYSPPLYQLSYHGVTWRDWSVVRGGHCDRPPTSAGHTCLNGGIPEGGSHVCQVTL